MTQKRLSVHPSIHPPARRAWKSTLLVAATPLLLLGAARAQFTWDPALNKTGSDGPGTWNTTSALWASGGVDTTWVNSTTSTATFGANAGTAGLVTIAGGITAGSVTFSPAASGTYTVGGGTLTLGGVATITANAAAAISAAVNAGGGAFTKAGTGTLTLSGGLTNVSSIQVNAGTLAAAAGSALGGTTTIVNIANGAKLQTGSGTISNPLVFNGGTGDVASIGGSTLTGTTVLNSGDNSFSATTAATISGAISGTGNMVKNGGQRIALTGANTYTGTTTISNGNLTVGNGGTTGSLGSGAVVNNAQLAFNRSNSFTVANAISGAGSITKAGAGTLTLTGTSTFTGVATVAAGTLLINGTVTGSTATGSISQVIVASGARLGGTGSYAGASAGAITVQAGGQFSPGDFGTVGQFNATSLSLTSNSTTACLFFDLGANSATSDLLTLAGAFTRASTAATYIIDFNQTGVLGQTYTLISYGTALTGTALSVSNITATNLPGGYGANFALNGNNLVVTIVPEPSTNVLCALTAIGLTGLAITRRRQTSSPR